MAEASFVLAQFGMFPPPTKIGKRYQTLQLYIFMFALVSAKVSLLMSFVSAYECNLVVALTDLMFPDWVAITASCLVTRLEGLVIPVCLKPQEQAEAWFATRRRFMIGCFFCSASLLVS